MKNHYSWWRNRTKPTTTKVSRKLRSEVGKMRKEVSNLKVSEHYPDPLRMLPLCECVDQREVKAALVKLLEWFGSDSETRPLFCNMEPGYFYLLAGMLNRLGYVEHGVSIRYGWLTERGCGLLGLIKPEPKAKRRKRV